LILGTVSVKRGETGAYEVTTVGGETIEAFVPAPLPPDPPLEFGADLQGLLEDATHALGRLDGAAARLPDTQFFVYAYVRKEAVLSSQIEGTQSSLSDLMLHELEEAPGVPTDDVIEVSNYVAALQHGLDRIRRGFPISNRLIREIHEVLMRSGRGSGKDPGRFRRSQNWLGGTRPGNAAFVPPPHQKVADGMADLESFIHAEGDGLSELVRAGLAHVQFETIHPFLDGNGRVGRLLTTLMLVDAGLLREPLLYLSLYFKQHRPVYYELLANVRTTGDWEAWLAFFFSGVRETAESALATEGRLGELFAAHREALRKGGRRTASALRVHEALKGRPLLTISAACRITGLSFPAVSSAMELLEEFGVVKEVTGRKRGRAYTYQRYVEILSEGTEPL
jgi:Fic family protein